MLRQLVNDPKDLETLMAVMDKIYACRRLTDSVQREECAREVVAMYYSGVTDPDELLSLMEG